MTKRKNKAKAKEAIKDTIKCPNKATFERMEPFLYIVKTAVFSGIGLTQMNYVPHPAHCVETLICSNNKLTALPETLPTTLKYLDCSKNQLLYLPDPLPTGLVSLKCADNETLVGLSDLPEALKYLYCGNSNLKYLPALPKTLERLYCEGNSLTDLPLWITGYDALTHLICSGNRLTQLPAVLPPALKILKCDGN